MMTQRIGILLATACLALGSSARADSTNLVQNGDFETGDLTNWTLSGDPTWNLVGFRDVSYVMQFGSSDLSTLTQTLTTVPGQTYDFHFDLAVEAGTDASSVFQANWNGSPVLNITDMTSHWLTPNDFTVTATDTTTAIQFEAQNTQSFFSIDNVTVDPVPEPATWALIMSGFGMLFAFQRRHRKAV